MFQFRRFPTYCYLIHKRLTEYCSAGFPHSDIHGSMPAFDSPWLFVDRYVLHRLPMPRHSPCALISLTFFRIMCPLVILNSTYCSLSYPLIFSEKFKASNICYIISLFPFHISCIQFSRYIFLTSNISETVRFLSTRCCLQNAVYQFVPFTLLKATARVPVDTMLFTKTLCLNAILCNLR